MSLQGNLSSVSFPDLLQLLTMGGKTGTLRLQQDESKKEIYLKSGQIIYAASDNLEDSFENVLIRRGSITIEELNKAKEVSKITGKELPATLVFLNILTKEKVAEFVHRHVEDIVFSLFSWDEAVFIFDEGKLPDVEFVVHALNTMNILLEGTRRIDEWTRVQKNLPSDNAILRVVSSAFNDNKSLQISPEDIQVLSMIDGERNIHEIKEKSPLDLFATARSLHNLILSQIVKVVGLKESSKNTSMKEDEIINELVAMYKICYESTLVVMSKKLGKGAAKKISKILSDGKRMYDVVGYVSFDGKSFDFSNFLEMSKRELSPELKMHSISSGLAYILGEMISYSSNTLGSKIKAMIQKTIKDHTNQIISNNREEFTKFGFIKDFYRAAGFNVN